MSHSDRFRLSPRGLLLTAISAAFAQSSLANSGRVDFTAGRVTVTGSDGSSRPLARGSEVKSGDRIVSDTNGRAQIRFSDGSFVSLQPNTDFDIKNYAFTGKADGTEKALFGLLKGAMRTVTGLVGRVNRDTYLVTTPTATIGIRGTGGVISVSLDGSTLVLGTSGVWTLTNPGGTLDIPAGRAGFAGPNTNQPPQQASQGPVVPAPQSAGMQVQQKLEEERQQTFSQAENRTSSGNQETVPSHPTTPSTFKPLVSGTNYAVAYSGAEGASMFRAVPTKADFNGIGMMTGFDGDIGSYTLQGTHADFATTDGVIAWGRWIGQVDATSCCTTTNFSTTQGLHYVVGVPTPATGIPSGAYTYNMLGATSPTAVQGGVTPGTLSSATMTGDFSNSMVQVSFSGTIGDAANVKNFTATNLFGNMSNNGGAAVFSASGNYSGSLASCCGSASVSGFFAGTGASHAGFTYLLHNTTVGSSVNGAVALGKGSATSPIPR